MNFTSEVDVRQKLELQYHKGDISLSEFEDWFVPKSWNFDENASLTLQSLVADIELLLAEYSNGDWTEPQLKEKLRSAATVYRATYVFDLTENKTAEPVHLTFSGSALHRSDSSPPSDIRLVEEYA